MLDDLFGWLFDLLADLWNMIKAVLPYLLIAAALYIAFIGPISLGWLVAGLELSGTAAALALGGLSFLFAPGETADVFAKTADAVGSAAGSIVEAGVAVVSDTLGSILTSGPMFAIFLSVLLFWLLSRKKREKEQLLPEPTSSVVALEGELYE